MISQELQSGFRADAGHSGNIIRGITRKSQHVNHLLRLNAKLLHYALLINGFILHGIPDNAPVTHQLHEILVAGYHHHMKILVPGNAGKGADEIICLKSLLLNNGDIHGCDNLFDPGNLHGHLLGHWRPVGLILIIHSVAECGPFDIKKHGQIIGLPLLYQFKQHHGKPVGGIGGKPL